MKGTTNAKYPAMHHDFVPAKEPPVTWIEVFRFVWWSLMVMAKQLRNDMMELHNGFSTPFTTDLPSHFLYIPVGRQDPRLVLCGPHDRMYVRIIPDKTTRRYEELESLDRFPVKQIINCASNNYGGFSKLEHGAGDVVEKALAKLPFAPGPPSLEDSVRAECSRYMGFEVCDTAPSGFSSNMLAFRTVCATARSQGRKCIFLCDRDCHNSMLTGAYNNKDATTHKFNHNDLTDLKLKLRMSRQKHPGAMLCVAVEGIYSMKGSIAPIPAILGLKSVYGFKLLVDEAHSFMALGSAGRGSFNHWQDLGFDCPLAQADIMTCMFSKSVGCTGGMVLANGEFAAELSVQGERLRQNGSERLSTAVLIRVLSVLRKPLLVQRRMELARAKATYAAHVLARAGCRVLSSPGSPIICFPVGTVRQVAKFHGEALKRGVAIVGGVPPATPVWGCRVRMCIFATLSWADMHTALATAISVCVKHGVAGVQNIELDSGMLSLDNIGENQAIEEQSREVDGALGEAIDVLAASSPQPHDIGHDSEVVAAGIASLGRYGIGPCSARWFYGSFDVFVELEQRLARLYPSLKRHSGRCRAMVCGDAEVTIGSSFAARTVVPYSRALENLVLIPSSAPHYVVEAVKVAKASAARKLVFYDRTEDIPTIFAQNRLRSKRTAHLTLYLETTDSSGKPLELLPLLNSLSSLTAAQLAGATVFLDDRNGLAKLGPRRLGFLDHLESLHGEDVLVRVLGARSASFDILVAGSWYHAFGHQGGYVTGSAAAVECLTWDARAYFFSTPPMPLQTSMSSRALKALEGKAVA